MPSASAAEPACIVFTVFHAITSIGRSMAITIVACRDMLPDPEFYAQCLRESFDELYRSSCGAPESQSA